MSSYHDETGYTLVEIILVISILLLIALMTFLVMNPKSQLDKVYNVRRKQELAIIQRVFEDYYNDKSQYPVSGELCFDTPKEVDGVCSCHVCGLATKSNPLASYMPQQFCDPEYPKHTYLYQYDCSTDSPTWYRVCAKLNDSDPSATGQGNYNYGVSSANVTVEECNGIAASKSNDDVTGTGGSTDDGTGGSSGNTTPTPTLEPGTPTPPAGLPPFCPADPQTKYCFKGGICNACGDLANCRNAFSCDQPLQLFSNFSCSAVCE